MAKIPLGDFGNAIAAPRPSVRQVDTSQNGLVEAAGFVSSLINEELDAQAVSEATTQIQAGKLDLDAFARDLEEKPYDDEGKPRFEDAEKRYQAASQERISRALRESKSPKARQIIQRDLGNYAVTGQIKISDLSRKLEVDHYKARGFENLGLAVTSGDESQVDVILAGMVKTGIVSSVDAVKEREKAKKQIEYGRNFNLIQAAQTKEQLYEVRGRLSQFNPKLSPEDNARLYDSVNQRIDRYDKEAEQELKKTQDGAMEDLTNLSISGKLNADVLLFNSDRLSKTDRNILAGLVRQQEKEGNDDPDTVRRLQIGVLTGTIGEKELTRIASGYNSADGTTGDSRISTQTYRQLMSDIRTMKDERFQQSERKYDTEDYKAAREFLRLRVPKKATGSGIFDSFLLDKDDSEKLAMALSALHQRAGEGRADHLKWAQDYLAISGAKPEQVKPIPRTESSGPVTDKRPVPPSNVMQIPPHVQKARDDLRLSVLRSELASERANLTIAKTPAERRRAEQNIRHIGEELRKLGVKP